MEHKLKIYQTKGCKEEESCFLFDQEGGGVFYSLKDISVGVYPYLVFDIENHEGFSVCLNIGFWENGIEKPPDLFIAIGVLPDIKTTVSVPLEYLNGQILFGKRQPGILKTVVKGNKINLEKLKAFAIGIPASHKNIKLGIGNIRLSDEPVVSHIDTLSLVDPLGQYSKKDWIGKTKDQPASKGYLRQLLQEAKQFLSTHRDEYYGHTEKQFEATGFFRIEKEDNGRYWMVTPDGYGFFSTGLDCVNPNAGGPVDETGATRDCLVSNLQYAFGEEWYEAWCQITKYRLVKWKINTIAAWSDMDFAKQAKIPYVAMLRDYPGTAESIYRDFPDVFSPTYQRNAEQYASQLLAYQDDTYLIGYFMSNEPNWAFVDHLNLGYELIRNPKELCSKKKLTEFLKERYGETIEKLNQAWKVRVGCFEEIGYMGEFPVLSETGMEDLHEFSRILIEEYIKIPALALKKADPNHLNLGIRYAYISSPALFSGSAYFDVFSINCYEKICNPSVEKVFEAVQMPIMIGEFHFGAIDRGLPATGIRGAASQEERGKAIRHYIEQAATIPSCLGIHYFQYNDQPFLGRFDGENYNIGLVDICNQEYPEVVEHLTAANRRIYEIIEKQEAPADMEIDYIPAIFY